VIRLARIELYKLLSLRIAFGLLATSAALTALFTTLEASRAGNSGSDVGPLFTSSGLGTVTTTTGWSMLFAAVLGAVVAAGEFRHSTATLTFLGTPDRNRVMVAKTLCCSLSGGAFGLASGLVATAIGLAITAGHGYHVALGAAPMVGHIGGAVLGAALFGAIGAVVGMLLRSQLAAVIGIFVWGLVLESLVGGLFISVRPYLPYTAATTLAGIKLGGAAFGPAHGLSGGSPLPFAAAAALVAGVGALIGIVAARTTLKKDVT